MREGPEVAIRELTDEEYNADGTYAFPPHPRSLEQHIAFWESVPIPDEKLTQVLNAYGDMIADDTREEAARVVDEWKIRNPDPTERSRSQKAFDDARLWKEEGSLVFNEALERGRRSAPTIYRTSIRPIIRAGQMMIYGRPLQEDEMERLRQHEMVINGQVQTVGQIYETYQLDRLSDIIP